MLMNAKDFCRETGWPLKTIRRMCRTGQLECWQQGRVYLIDKEATMLRLELFKQQPCPAGVAELPRQRRSRILSLPGANGFDGYASRAERMKAKLLGKGKTANGANAGGQK
jgi:hypothetical protein